MNEITRIHLAKTPYNIETLAQGALRTYLDAIEKALHADADAMREIESRMTELLADRGISGETVITMADVDALQKQLGDPKDFAGEDISDDSISTQTPKKRLMRDTSNAMLGGVCSGIAAYFGWDAVWVRIAAVILLFITSGVMIPIYIVLLVVMPEARTAADRLEMTGKAVTLESLKQNATTVVKQVEPVLIKLLRYITGTALVIGSVMALVTAITGVWYIMSHLNDFNFYDGEPTTAIATGLMALGGVMLATLLALIAKMLFGRMVTQRLIIGAIIAVVIGAASFGAGTAITVSQVYDFQRKTATSDTTKPLDVEGVFDGVKAIDVRSRNINMHYVVSDVKQKGSYTYNSYTINNPDVKLTRLGDTLIVEGTFKDGPGCSGRFVVCGSMTLNVNLTGPAVERLTTNALTTYDAIQQDTLSLDQKSATDVTINSVGTIGVLNVKTNGGNLTATNATITTVNIDTARATSAFASIKNLTITSPDTNCAERPNTVSALHATSVNVNGQAWEQLNRYDCLMVQVGAQG